MNDDLPMTDDLKSLIAALTNLIDHAFRQAAHYADDELIAHAITSAARIAHQRNMRRFAEDWIYET